VGYKYPFLNTSAEAENVKSNWISLPVGGVQIPFLSTNAEAENINSNWISLPVGVDPSRSFDPGL
jgi:hypothetical protein